MTMEKALDTRGIGGAIFLVVAFAMFFVLSVIILIIMEGVSAMVSLSLPQSVLEEERMLTLKTASLFASRVGRVLLQVRRVWRMAICAVLVQATA